ncbi:TIGR02996 domain-containing protein [Gemmata sp.]|uniref:TIGR02996 domain-containing protein n=1 Tax=Gemmata sp. TaxID=1914242 RepID=UPI003F71FADF
MTEDEALIRAVVDNPGDDTPRLVYADWLDDRDDPRGPYLRAEHEWAATHDPSERETLRQMAKALDPVWVARVSRPPIGVCCDHLRLSATGEVNGSEDIDAAGKELDVNLPPQLRALLLNYSIGHLRGGPFVLPRKGERNHWGVVAVACLIDPDFNDAMVSYELVDRTIHLREEYELPITHVFLAELHAEVVVVSCRKGNAGTVHYWNGFEVRAEKIADTVGDFLAMLIPKSWPLTDKDFSPNP